MKHRTVWGVVAAIAGVALLVGGVATASNMGFKYVPQIPGTPNNAFNLSLPWNNSFTNAQSIFGDFATQSQTVDHLSYYTVDQQFREWFGPGTGTDNFPVTKGDAVIVFGSGPSGQTPVVVGSHDPNFTFTFPVGSFNAAAPYHQTYTVAQNLYLALQTQCPGGAASINKLSKYTADQQFREWFGPGTGTDNFPMDLGAGVIVFMNNACSGFVWAHY